MINSTYEVMQTVLDDLKELLKDKTYEIDGEQIPFKYYLQEVPAPTSDDDDFEILPYCLVQCLEGTFNEWNNTRELSLAVIFCIYNADSNKTGSMEVINLVDEVYKHYMQSTKIGTNVIQLPIDFTTQTLTEEDTYPYYFCALKINLECNGSYLSDDDLT